MTIGRPVLEYWTMGNANKVNRGWYGLRPRLSPPRRGKHQHQVWRALVALGRPVSTHELFEFVWPHLDVGKRWPRWRWYVVRYAAERYAERVLL
jgi:hypothetical protein